MSLEKANITWSAKQIKTMVGNGKISFDHIVQRSFVWEKSRKTGLIESMLLGYPVPVVYAKRNTDDNNNKEYLVLDGQQRLSTIAGFLNDEFALTPIPVIVYHDENLNYDCEADISGLKFSELPEELQDKLLTTMFTIIYFDNLTEEEEKELFKRLNAGKPLSSKSRLLASCKDIRGILDIGSHDLFKEMLTEKSRANKNQATIVMKAWCMMNQDIADVTFESKVFNPLVENTEIEEWQKNELNTVFNYIMEVHAILADRKEKKVAKKLYTETHLVSLIPFVYSACINGIATELFADWVTDFFGSDSNASVSDVYNDASGSGSAKQANIFARNTALQESFNEFFKEESFN